MSAKAGEAHRKEAETASAESIGEKDCMRMEISVVAMTSAEAGCTATTVAASGCFHR
ncbi:hypothetical protein BQ8482_90285 [Mesorhizobium delmotii]|uniref:Uncharacterized protein n=1 Tax=Mesorhizobium delmotii TaxID=1631247 RepID=A0A2P9AXL2_9HYPH|nr:hypothetical protein BQ8482_90285 [Mesorhizobium delmotii]